MLGRAFVALLSRERVPFASVSAPEIDLSDGESVRSSVSAGVRTVINCAAFTEVDAAEAREEAANAVNGTGVGWLAKRCAQIGARIVHFSTDYVFDGQADRPYAVDHPLIPVNAYGRSKALGEQHVERSGAEYLLIRTSWLYAPWGRNFVLTLRDLMQTHETLKVVDDQVGRPTSAEYLAERSLGLLRRGCNGIFHVADGGECSWYGLACAIAQITSAHCSVIPCRAAEYPRPARRPKYSVLDLSLVERELGPSQPWSQNLERVLRAVGPVSS
jgi:dTDP-4-dehydrorhamnose reductase